MNKKPNFLKMDRTAYDKFMCATFPKMFANRSKTMKESCMYWGFDINKGWYEILYNLCVKLQAIYDSTGFLVIFDQIKEKFASGRFYNTVYNDNETHTAANINIWHDIIDDLVSNAEDKCGRTDEITGERINGPLQKGHWLYAMSEETYNKTFPDRVEQKDSHSL